MKAGDLSTAEQAIKIDRIVVACDMECMAMGKRGDEQASMFVTYKDLPRSAGLPFYTAVERLLRKGGFDRYVEGLCAKFYSADELGRPSLAPGQYFRGLLVGYFEGIGSERGIAWRLADSLSVRNFLGLAAGREPPDHSTISRTRRRIDVETHQAVFNWMLALLTKEGLLQGKTLGVDGTTLEANAAMRSIVRRDDGRSYNEFLTDLAHASGVATPTREDLARIDRQRRKKTSNVDWTNPHDPDAQVTKMKDGRTHLSHKQEHVVDMDSGAIVAVTISGGAAGDTMTVEGTMEAAQKNLADARELDEDDDDNDDDDNDDGSGQSELVADKGYHSKAVLLALRLAGWRTYVSEPRRGRQRWSGQQAEQAAVYSNRRRKDGARGQCLMRKRGELIERSFAHVLDTGGMRRTHVRGHENIAKRMLIQVAGFNLGLLMRKIFGVGTPRGLQGRPAAVAAMLFALVHAVADALSLSWATRGHHPSSPIIHATSRRLPHARPLRLASTTGC